MSEAVTRYREAVVRRVLDGDGDASRERRKAAFDHDPTVPLLDKVTRNAWKVTDEDVAAATAAGLSEDQIFELVACAAVGQATRQIDAALAMRHDDHHHDMTTTWNRGRHRRRRRRRRRAVAVATAGHGHAVMSAATSTPPNSPASTRSARTSSARCRISGIRTRRSRSTGTSAPRPASPRCSSKARPA